MARWKAVYLLNGFDRLWSVIQNFQTVAGLAGVPAMMRLTQDNTIASGNWFCRELCAIVIVNSKLLTGNEFLSTGDGFTVYVSTPGGGTLSGQSVGGLVEFLYNVGNGNWAGPPLQVLNRPPSRPLSLRTVLAQAA
jgi:hypothetical protein